MNVESTAVPQNKPLLKKARSWLFRIFRLTDAPVVKVYTCYGNKTTCFLSGHVLTLSPLPRKRYRRYYWVNAFALLRLFMVKTKKDALLEFSWAGKIYRTTSEKDGFFKFEWKPLQTLTPGNYEVQVNLVSPRGVILATGSAKLMIPQPGQFAFISDIDDTFLISHSSNLRKRLFVLLTENARSRKPFEGVAEHYRLLSLAGDAEKTTNPFFYVSSSEWNLYDYIRDFSEQNKMPDGVYLLNQMKTFSQVFKTGQNNHGTKFMRISRILEAYTDQRFVLLGDDSQDDPFIYAAVTEHFPGRIFCVYIRKVTRMPKAGIPEKLKFMQENGTHYCYFTNSAEAIIHSQKIGLI